MYMQCSYLLFGILATFSYTVFSSESTIVIPVQVINSTSDGACPSEILLAAAKQQAKAEVASALNDCCNNIGTEANPLNSCSDLPADSPAGYYWVLPSTGPPAVQRYCNTPSGCGGTRSWTRIGYLNMSDPEQNCPSNWLTKTSPIRTCGRGLNTRVGCNSLFFPTSGLAYNQVCGRIIAYHEGAADAFNFASSVDSTYLDGISLTHGPVNSRQHIWSFVAAVGEVGSFHSSWQCDCSNSGTWPHSTSFIGNNYFCDTGNHASSWTTALTYYDDPLWDGQGCGIQSTCCQFNNPPWFSTSLPQPTTDNLEVRNCRYQSGDGYDSLVELIEIYIQ